MRGGVEDLDELGQHNYWLKIIDSVVNGVKFEMQPDGGIRCTGSSGGNWTASKQNFARLEDMGVWPGDSMRLDNLGGGSAQVRAIFMRQNGMETETLVNNNRSRVVSQDAVSVALDVVFPNMQGQTIDEVVYPMLVKGTERPLNYVPYF